ncbi:MAG: PmoA family protein [Thermoguttaceae bacterium]|nr:PmoA family protein [Thermoguttaceae bacterium]
MTCLWRVVGLAIVLGCPISAAARADEGRIELTVEAGAHDRIQCPVRTLVKCPAELAEATAIILTDGKGLSIPAQLAAPGLLSREKAGTETTVRELHFILPKLGKGERLTLVGKAVAEAPAGFAWRDNPEQYYAELSHADRPVMRYMYTPIEVAEKEGDTYFKVFHHLYDPAGTRFVTKGDKDGLFPHHRGLFFGFSRITYGETKANTWACNKGNHQSHEGFLGCEAGPVLGRHLVAVDWHGPDQRVYAKEQRELSAYHVPGGQMVEFAARLASTVGKVMLDGDPAHAGFQFRAAQEVADNPEGTYYLRPDGKGEPGQFRNWSAKDPDPRCVNMPWHAVSFEIGPKRYTAVYMDRPENPRESRYGERNYARFGCYFEYELDEGNDLLIAYRLWLQEGEMTLEQAAALRADFAEPPAVSVR